MGRAISYREAARFASVHPATLRDDLPLTIEGLWNVPPEQRAPLLGARLLPLVSKAQPEVGAGLRLLGHCGFRAILRVAGQWDASLQRMALALAHVSKTGSHALLCSPSLMAKSSA